MSDSSAAPSASVSRAPIPRRRWVLFAAMLAMFMSAVESTIVSTAMPTIVTVLGGFHLLSWVFAAYLLTQAVTVPVYGKLADLYGRKRVLYAGIAIFLVSSLMCGFVSGMPGLIVFRFLQGLGAGAIVPVAFTIVGDIYAPAERARVQAQVTSVWGVASVIGPLLGAFLVQHVGWQTIFWVNLPIGFVAVGLMEWSFREAPHPSRHDIDYLGSALMMMGSGALILALVQANALPPLVVAALVAASAGMLTTFFWHERRASEPMMPPILFRHPAIAASNVGGLITGAGMMATVVFLPTYVQGVMGRDAVAAGFALTAMSIGWPLGAVIVGRLMARLSYRTIVAAGSVALVAGSAMLIALDASRGPVWAGGGAFLTGLGMGFTSTTYVVAAQASVDWSQRGIATSMALFTRLLGQSVGAAIFGGVLNVALALRIPDSGRAVEGLMEPAQRAALGSETVARLSQSVADALHIVYLVGGAAALCTLPLALLIPRGLGTKHALHD